MFLKFSTEANLASGSVVTSAASGGKIDGTAVAGEDVILLTGSGAARLAHLKKQSGKPNLRLRLYVKGGGCQGFEYVFKTTEEEVAEDDYVFITNEESLIVDETSLELVKGAKVDFTQDLIKEAFEVIDNPNADAACGCGASFSAKMEF